MSYIATKRVIHGGKIFKKGSHINLEEKIMNRLKLSSSIKDESNAEQSQKEKKVSKPSERKEEMVISDKSNVEEFDGDKDDDK